MKVYVIHPRYPKGLGAPHFVPSKSSALAASFPNLALPTLAALTPDLEMSFCDEMIESVDLDLQCDIVAITGYVSQGPRMRELAQEFRRRGRTVVIGGPYASLNPDYFKDCADVHVQGEAERLWPLVARDIERGCAEPVYKEDGIVDIHTSPIPLWDQVPVERYASGVVQSSRGCPYECNFCDVIVYLGRKQRHKHPERVAEEAEAAYQHGFRTILIADDNFTVNRKKASGILGAIKEWNAGKQEPAHFMTQASVDIARNDELLELSRDAGLRMIFMGVETPNKESLKSVKKLQNVEADLLASIAKVHSYGIDIHGGLMIGFDHDTRDTFREQVEFWQEAACPIVGVSVLVAPFGTPLYAQMKKDGRLIHDGVSGSAEMHPSPMNITNFVPKNLKMAELAIGNRWLLNQLYSPQNFSQRLHRLFDGWPEERVGEARGSAKDIAPMFDLLNFRDLGPEFADLPTNAFRLWRRKPSGWWTVVLSLVYYRTWVGMMKEMGLLEPELATLDKPPFDEYDLNGEAMQAAERWYQQQEY